jgi:hypothetical protein
MSRRHWFGVTIVGASLLAGSLNAFAATTTGPPPELPRPACTKRLADAEGDAAIDYTGAGATKSTTGSVDGVDITGLHVRLTDTSLVVLMAIKKIPAASAMPAYDASYRYTVTFKFGSRVFTFGNQLVNPGQPGQPADGALFPQANMGTGANDSLPGFTAGIDDKNGYVWWTAPRAKVESNLGGPLVEGDTFTAIYGKTVAFLSQHGSNADDTTVPVADAVYKVGDDYCFGAPPATLEDLSADDVTFGHAAAIGATLLDEAGSGIGGKQVQFSVAGEPGAPMTATTDDDGYAEVKYTPTLPAGTYAVTALFAGDTEAGKAKATGTVVVKAAGRSFKPLAVAKPTTTTRTVTAILLNDAKAPMAGQKVDFYVNGKKTGSPVTTDAAGKAVFKAAKPGQTVQAKVTEVAGKYLAAASNSAKV